MLLPDVDDSRFIESQRFTTRLFVHPENGGLRSIGVVLVGLRVPEDFDDTSIWQSQAPNLVA